MQTTRGISLIEVIIGVTILSLLVISMSQVVGVFVSGTKTALERVEAVYLAEEGLEMLRFMRDDDWNNIDSLALNTTLYLDVTTTTISTSVTPEVVRGFTRSFEVSEVPRESGSHDVAFGGGGGTYIDPDSVLVTTTVAGPTATVTLSTLLTNIEEL